MNRHMDLIQRAEKSLQTVCQMIRCGGQCHNGRSDHKVNKTDCHSSSKNKTFLRNLDDSETPQYFTWRQDNIEHNGDQKDHHNGLQTFEHEFHRNFGKNDHRCQKYSCHCISRKCMEYKDRDDEHQRTHQLCSRIHFVQNGICRIILSYCNVSDHTSCPPSFSSCSADFLSIVSF